VPVLRQQSYPVVPVQALAQVPQCRHSGWDVMLTQPSGEHSVVGAGQTQTELVHCFPPVQAVPQAPQFNTSLVRSLHVPPQSVSCVVPRTGQTQVLFAQSLPVGQTLAHAPQFSLSVAVSVHHGEQNTSVTGHLQLPPWQVCPPMHLVPQVPQLLLSVWGSLQVVPGHGCWPVGHWQPAPTHTCPLGHTVVQEPQCWVLVCRSVQTPLHATSPAWQQVPLPQS
jgi:hypothetical protein